MPSRIKQPSCKEGYKVPISSSPATTRASVPTPLTTASVARRLVRSEANGSRLGAIGTTSDDGHHRVWSSALRPPGSGSPRSGASPVNTDLNGATAHDIRWVALRLGLSVHTVRALARRRALVHYRLGRRIVFLEGDVLAYLQRHRVEAPSEAARP
jgi:hypothetical protein